MDSVFQIVMENVSFLNASGYVFLLLTMALFYLLIRRDSGAKILTAFSILSLMLLINLWTANSLLDFYFSKENYWKAFMMIPFVPICAYAAVLALSHAKAKKECAVIAVGMFLMLLLAGPVFGDKEAFLKKADGTMEEKYQEIVDIIDKNECAKVLANDEILSYIRAKSAEIGMLYEVSLMNSNCAADYYDKAVCQVHEDINQPENRLGNIVRVCRGNQCNYLVLPLYVDERWEMEQNGFEVLTENDDYVLYFCE